MRGDQPQNLDDTGAEPEAANSAPLGAAVGVERLPTRKCDGTGKDMECIKKFADPAALTAVASASALKNNEILRRKAKESGKIPKGL